MINYIIGALAGGVFGYLVLYRLIGCANGSCPITANPYISTIYGVILGVLISGMLSTPAKQFEPRKTQKQDEAPYRRITADEAKRKMDSRDEIIILDVRTKEEYEQEHIPNSILIPNESITAAKPKFLPDTDAEILIYCRSGVRSAHAAKKLIALGYTNVYDFGGIIEWPYDKVSG